MKQVVNVTPQQHKMPYMGSNQYYEHKEGIFRYYFNQAFKHFAKHHSVLHNSPLWPCFLLVISPKIYKIAHRDDDTDSKTQIPMQAWEGSRKLNLQGLEEEILMIFACNF